MWGGRPLAVGELEAVVGLEAIGELEAVGELELERPMSASLAPGHAVENGLESPSAES